jgi:hypothetical protein
MGRTESLLGSGAKTLDVLLGMLEGLAPLSEASRSEIERRL